MNVYEADLRGARAAWSRALATTPGPIGREAEMELGQEMEEWEHRVLSLALTHENGRTVVEQLRARLDAGDVRVDDVLRDIDRTHPTFEEAGATLRALAALETILKDSAAIATAGLSRTAIRKLMEQFYATTDVRDVNGLDAARRALLRSKSRFVHANIRLVAAIARKPEFQDRGLDLLDLVQEGTFGLMHAVDNFDWRRGFKFSTYATWWIRQALQRAVAEHSRNIRLPFGVSELLHKINRVTREYAVRHGREPTREELSRILDVAADRISVALEAARIEPVALQTPIGEDDSGQLGDLVADPNAVVGDEMALKNAIARGTVEALAVLKPREQEVLRKRFGIDDGRERTLQDIANELGLTRERIRQIEMRALEKLRRELASVHLEELAAP